MVWFSLSEALVVKRVHRRAYPEGYKKGRHEYECFTIFISGRKLLNIHMALDRARLSLRLYNVMPIESNMSCNTLCRTGHSLRLCGLLQDQGMT